MLHLAFICIAFKDAITYRIIQRGILTKTVRFFSTEKAIVT